MIVRRRHARCRPRRDPSRRPAGGAAAPSSIHLRPRFLLLVAAGGTVGTAAREAVALTVPPVGGVPVGILAVNLAGAFVLGGLLEALLRSGDDVGRRRLLRLGLGTGFCGGFTTYSALATASALLLADGAGAAAAGYAGATLLLGAAATWAGVLVGVRASRGAG